MAYNYSSPQTALEQIKRHRKYYFSGGDLHLLVDGFIFRVHRYFFERESACFRERLGAPAPPGQPPKGSSEAHPLPLDGVSEDKLSKFLWVFYNPQYSIYDAALEDWIDILQLAYDWRFREVKKLCEREIEKFEIAPVNKIELYQRYELDRVLLIPSFLYLCTRAEPISLKEGRQIGLETALLIARARECARSMPTSNGVRSPTAADLKEAEMVSLIKEVFGMPAGPPSPSLVPLKNGIGATKINGATYDTNTEALKPSLPPPHGVSLAATSLLQTGSRPSVSPSSPAPRSVPTIAEPTPPGNTAVRGSAPAPASNSTSSWLSGMSGLVGMTKNKAVDPSAISPTNAPPPAGAGNGTDAAADGGGTEAAADPDPDKTKTEAEKDLLSAVKSGDAKDDVADTGDEGAGTGGRVKKKKSGRGGKA